MRAKERERIKHNNDVIRIIGLMGKTHICDNYIMEKRNLFLSTRVIIKIIYIIRHTIRFLSVFSSAICR